MKVHNKFRITIFDGTGRSPLQPLSQKIAFGIEKTGKSRDRPDRKQVG